jgi:osmotically-inducible protein OsmY
MARTKKMSLEEQLADRGFDSASVVRTHHDGAMEVQANVLHPLPIGGQDPLYAFVPVDLTVTVDKKGGVRTITGGVPTEDCIADATRFAQSLRDHGQVADESETNLAAAEQEARPASGVTHQIRRDEQGRRVLQRTRFSIA